MGVKQLDGMCVYKGLCFTWGSVMQINDLLQCRAEQHKACTPVHHSTASVPPLQAGWKKKITWAHSEGLGSRRRGVYPFCSEAPAIHPFFLYTRQDDHDIRSALTKLERRRPELSEATSIAPRHHLRKVSFHLKKRGGGERNRQYLLYHHT